jgi:hypothetical protein
MMEEKMVELKAPQKAHCLDMKRECSMELAKAEWKVGMLVVL